MQKIDRIYQQYYTWICLYNKFRIQNILILPSILKLLLSIIERLVYLKPIIVTPQY